MGPARMAGDQDSAEGDLTLELGVDVSAGDVEVSPSPGLVCDRLQQNSQGQPARNPESDEGVSGRLQ